ncbi:MULTISPECIES: hypothetical protein [Gordonia]|nr:hypothetical protein [Gordonia sp. UBA5067]
MDSTEPAMMRVPDRGHENEPARRRRLDWVRGLSGSALKSLDRFDLDPARLVGNIENLVGSVAIPVGLAGPLLFDGNRATGWIPAPFATTEGALVASATRGAHAVSCAGGVRTRVLGQQMVRSPRFDFTDIVAASRFATWIAEQTQDLSVQIAEVSRHARLIGLVPLQIGRSVDVVFEYETGDASGQNMTTACTWRSCLWIEEQLARHPEMALRSFCIEGNSAGDKKLSQRALANGRGMRVTAECHVDGETLERVLKVTRDDMLRAYGICVTGSALAGGFPNVNVANAIAAVFAATGQDIACVHESGSGILTMEPDGDGIYASLLLPTLSIGTVGGGTQLPQQNDYLEMIGCTGTGSAARLGEIIAGYALALDLSTMSAVIGGQFATAHERLGRNRPVQWFTRDDLNPALLGSVLDAGAVTAVDVVGDTDGNSVISELTQRVSTQKLVGVFPVDVTIDGGAEPLELIVKSKPLDTEVMLAAHRMVTLAGGRLSEAWSRGGDASGFLGTHMRELQLYREPAVAAGLLPHCYGIVEDPAREAFLLFLERLGDDVILIDSAERPQDWRPEHITGALTGIARLHGRWYGRVGELGELDWLGEPTEPARVIDMSELWLGLFEHHKKEYPDLLDDAWLAQIVAWIDDSADWWPEMAGLPQTLVHNDFNSRNIGLRVVADAPERFELVAYDWELATVHLPQRDLVEFLSYVLTPDTDLDTIRGYVEFHRAAVAAAAGVAIDRDEWARGFQLALADFVMRRISLYLMVHTLRRLPYIERVVNVCRRLSEV